MAASGRLDPALLLMMAKAYAGSKETDITREEVGGPQPGARESMNAAVGNGCRVVGLPAMPA